MITRLDIYVVLNSEQIRRILAAKNLRQIDVAVQLDITPNYWCQLMTHYRRPGPELRNRILKLTVFRGRRWEQIFQMQEPIPDV